MSSPLSPMRSTKTPTSPPPLTTTTTTTTTTTMMTTGTPAPTLRSHSTGSRTPLTFCSDMHNVSNLHVDRDGLRLALSPSPRSRGTFRDLITVPAAEAFDPGPWYFEICIRGMPPGGALVAVGCATLSTPPFEDGLGAVLGGIPGDLAQSVGLLSNGELQSHWRNQGLQSLPFAPPFREGDTVGVGSKPDQHALFFTHNGRLLGYFPLEPGVLCPDLAVVGFESVSVSIEANFGQAPFFFEPRLLVAAVPPPLDLDPVDPPFIKSLQKAQPDASPRAWVAAEHGMVKLGKKLSTYFTSPTTSSKLATMARLEADLAEAKDTVAALSRVLSERSGVVPSARNDDLLQELAMTCRKLLTRHANLVEEAPNAEMLNRLLMMNDRIGELLAAADSLLKTHTPFENDNDHNSSKAERVSRLLHILRAGDLLAQKNAAACLGDLAKNEGNLSIVLGLSGVHALVVKAKDENEDADLRQIVATALSQLAARLRANDEATAQAAAPCFGNELAEVLNAFRLSSEPLLVAKSIVNLITVFSHAPVPGWLECVIERGVPVLLGVLAIASAPLASTATQAALAGASGGAAAAAAASADSDPNTPTAAKLLPPAPRLLRRDSSTHRRASSWSHFEAPSPPSLPSDMNLVERTAALALAVLSRQPGAQSTLASLDGFFAVVAKLLASPDVQVAQHGAATLGGLFTSSDEDAFTRGFVAAQVLQSNVLGPLMALAQAPVLPEPTRGWVSLCITNLASHPSSRQALTQFGIDKCADACVRLLGGGKTPAAPSMMHRMMRGKSSSSSSPMSPGELKLASIAEAGVVDEAKLSAALLQILKLRPNVPGETFSRPGSLETVLALADSDDAAVVRNAAGMLVLMCRSPGLWAQSLPVLVRLVEHTDGDVRLAATRAIADVCNSAEMPMRVAALLTDLASKLPKAPGVPPSVVCRALEGLAAVVFSPNWEPRISFFGFGPKQAVLPFLLQAAQRAGDDPLAAMEAMHALTLACKAKGALSAHYRVETVRCALAPAAAVLARGTTDAALRHASEGLLASAVGFSVGDLQLVANDAELLGEWARLALDVKLCVLVDYCVFRLAAHAWPHTTDSSTLPPFPFYDARVDIAQLDALGRKDSARGAASMKRWTVKAALSEVASAPPAELFKSFTSALGTELFERLSHEFSQVAESPKKEFAVKAFTAVASTLSRAATPTTPPMDASFTPEPAEPRDWYDIILSVCNFTPHRFGTRGWDALPLLVTELLHEQSPGSTLARALATQPSMFQELDGGGGGPHGLLMHPRARSLVLGDVKHNVPLQVLPRLVADAPSAVLKDFPGVRVKSDGACQLVLRDCRLLGDARARLVDALFRAPAVTQLVFSSAVRLKDDEEEELVGLVADLPPTVTSLVFDRTLSPTGLRLVMVFLSQRKHVPLLLALTNLGLSGEDMEPVLRYTSRLNPSSRTFGTLRHLDLGGNALSDASVAALIHGQRAQR